MRDTIINLQNSDEWKIQLTISINFISSKDGEEERVMHSIVAIYKFSPYSDANGVIDEICESLRSKYQANLETSMRGKYFIFDSVELMHYKCHKVNFIRGGSNIDSTDWIKKEKKATINLKNIDDKCFQCAATVPSIIKKLNHIQKEFQILNFHK